MQKIKLFANYSIPVVWGIVGLVIGCVGMYLFLARIWTHVFVKPENVTPADFNMVVSLALITGLIVGSAALFNSAQRRWTFKH